jgi:hypothetical protein
MSVRWLLGWALIVAGAGRSVWAQGAQTVETVLAKAGIAGGGFSAAERSAKVQSSVTAKDGGATFVAYLTDEASSNSSGEMRVVRSDAGGRVRRLGVSLEGECEGSLEDMVARQGWMEITFHLNPSAGCVVVVSEDMRLSRQLDASGVMARVQGGLVLMGNARHFAPTHPYPVLLYDLAARKVTTIYPGKGDARWEAFAVKIRGLVPASCREGQMACDATEFSTDPDDFFAAPDGRSFRFKVTMSAEGFGERAAREIPDETVGYVCRLRGGTWVLRPE